MNEPKVIFLQVGEDYDPQEDNFKELGEVTWCVDDVDETDLEYCRITPAELAALEKFEADVLAVDAMNINVAAKWQYVKMLIDERKGT